LYAAHRPLSATVIFPENDKFVLVKRAHIYFAPVSIFFSDSVVGADAPAVVNGKLRILSFLLRFAFEFLILFLRIWFLVEDGGAAA
jgi:hypothetical protein